jgi:hypothetical protein
MLKRPEAIVPESFFQSVATDAGARRWSKVAPTRDGILASDRQSGSRQIETWQCSVWVIRAIFGRFVAFLLMP